MELGARVLGVVGVLFVVVITSHLYWHLADLKYPKPGR